MCVSRDRQRSSSNWSRKRRRYACNVSCWRASVPVLPESAARMRSKPVIWVTTGIMLLRCHCKLGRSSPAARRTALSAPGVPTTGRASVVKGESLRRCCRSHGPGRCCQTTASHSWKILSRQVVPHGPQQATARPLRSPTGRTSPASSICLRHRSTLLTACLDRAHRFVLRLTGR